MKKSNENYYFNKCIKEIREYMLKHEKNNILSESISLAGVALGVTGAAAGLLIVKNVLNKYSKDYETCNSFDYDDINRVKCNYMILDMIEQELLSNKTKCVNSDNPQECAALINSKLVNITTKKDEYSGKIIR